MIAAGGTWKGSLSAVGAPGPWETRGRRGGTKGQDQVNSYVCLCQLAIGQELVEEEQRGDRRADSGVALLKTLSGRLELEYGVGVSVSALQYICGPPGQARKANWSRTADQSTKTTKTWQAGTLHPPQSWTHYRTLLRVERQEVRSFYEIEAVKDGWSARQHCEPRSLWCLTLRAIILRPI